MTAAVRRSAIIRLLYVAGLAAGTFSHASILLRHGLHWTYGGMPSFTVFFWDSLTFIDPLIALLLFVKVRVALISLILLMLADVTQNGVILYRFGAVWWMVLDQALFLLFVLASAPFLWRSSRRTV